LSNEPAPEEPKETLPDHETSPLRVFVMEMHEVFLELIEVGFPEKMATAIVAHMLSDGIVGRQPNIVFEFEDDDDEDFDEDDEGTIDGDDGRIE
jgi:hypothetical protein